MPSIRWVMAAIAATVVATPAVRAAEPWTAIGPEGGHITALAVDPQHPQTVYAGGSSSGLLKSADAGATWKRLPTALAGASITTLALDPAKHQIFLVTAQFGPPPAPTAGQPHPRPAILPDSFVVLVMGK